MQVYKNCRKNKFFLLSNYQVIIQLSLLVKVLGKSEGFMAFFSFF